MNKQTMCDDKKEIEAFIKKPLKDQLVELLKDKACIEHPFIKTMLIQAGVDSNLCDSEGNILNE